MRDFGAALLCRLVRLPLHAQTRAGPRFAAARPFAIPPVTDCHPWPPSCTARTPGMAAGVVGIVVIVVFATLTVRWWCARPRTRPRVTVRVVSAPLEPQAADSEDGRGKQGICFGWAPWQPGSGVGT